MFLPRDPGTGYRNLSRCRAGVRREGTIRPTARVNLKGIADENCPQHLQDLILSRPCNPGKIGFVATSMSELQIAFLPRMALSR